MRVTILGGGGFRVPLICRELAASGLAVGEVVLYDVVPERLGVISAVLAADGLPLRTTTDLDTALRGADVIFAALRVGGLDGRVADERSALDAGVIGQETVGAGGLSYAARAVPVVDAIARRVAELAPRAWVISMTNPAGIVTEVMAATLGPRVVGVCDSPTGLVRRACAAAGVDPGTRLAQVPDGVEVDYLGLNHLGWLRGLRVDGTDRLPGLLADPDALKRTEEGRLFGADLLQALGTIPNEYLYWYYARSEALRDVRAAGRTRAEHVRAEQQRFFAAAAADPGRAAALWAEANDERNRSYFAELRSGERDAADVEAGGYEAIAVGLAAALTGVTGPTGSRGPAHPERPQRRHGPGAGPGRGHRDRVPGGQRRRGAAAGGAAVRSRAGPDEHGEELRAGHRLGRPDRLGRRRAARLRAAPPGRVARGRPHPVRGRARRCRRRSLELREPGGPGVQ